jgi:hypothetical protein
MLEPTTKLNHYARPFTWDKDLIRTLSGSRKGKRILRVIEHKAKLARMKRAKNRKNMLQLDMEVIN